MRHRPPLITATLVAVLLMAGCAGNRPSHGTRSNEPAVIVPPPVVRIEYTGEAPPPPRFEQPGPAPVAGQVWLGGYWTWTNGHHEWIPGRWESPRPGHYWVPYRWQQTGQQWRLHGGYWQAQ